MFGCSGPLWGGAAAWGARGCGGATGGAGVKPPRAATTATTPRLTARTVAASSFGRCAAVRKDDSARETTMAETPSAAGVAWPAAKTVAAFTVWDIHAGEGDTDLASGGRTAGNATPRRVSRSRSRSLPRSKRL